MKKKIFIDGKAGTTGLRIYERLYDRQDIEVTYLSDEDRKDPDKRREALNSCDIAFLCLPDEAAIQAVSMIDNPNVAVIDASTAHRTDEGWTYGFPELSKDFEDKLKNSKRIANPGCHASGFIALVYPLIEAGVLRPDAELSCHSITGYSGGGNKMIAEYRGDERDVLLDAPRQYGLTQKHKHLKEMQKLTGLKTTPAFCPIVADFYSGMELTVPLFKSNLVQGKTFEDVRNVLREHYKGKIVKYSDELGADGFISAHELMGKDSMVVTVVGNEERALLVACYDNLGKGASGAAVECMNILLGVDQTTGLVL